MVIGRWRKTVAGVLFGGVLFSVLALSVSPASAQNKKRSWEIFIYFGEYGGQTVPSAIQKGMVETYRLDPTLSVSTDGNTNPNTNFATRFCVVCRNLGATGPSDVYLGPDIQGQDPFPSTVRACPAGDPAALDPNTPYLDECDNDMEARYVYNAHGIATNGEVQRRDAEFLLGGRLGYNVTRHWEVEFDVGFAKQRLDMTRNLLPLLNEPVPNPAAPWFDRLARFYEFTWANRDYLFLGSDPKFDSTSGLLTGFDGIHEIPNVPQHRRSRNAGADIPALLPMPLAAAETFEDVTAFVNRVLLNPTALRNRANQINIDIFSTGLSGVYNFNTKPDSRIVPYLQAGAGRWIRRFDAPYEGENSDYLTYGGGLRFFVNEIFSFRAELRSVLFKQDTSRITASLPTQNVVDFTTSLGGGSCLRDQDPPQQQPPQECQASYIQRFQLNPPGFALPAGAAPGGRASIEFITETNDFWEARVGFDVLLGGR